MHIGLLIYGSLDTVSGGYLYDRKLVEYLRQEGDQVELVFLPLRNYPAHLTDNFSAGLRDRLLELQVDVLLQDELNHPSLFWLNRRLAEGKSYPIITIVHHLRSSEPRPIWQNQFYRMVERSYLMSVDGFIINSEATRNTLVDSGIEVASTPHIIANPAGDRFTPQIQENEITKRALEPGPLRLLFIGNLTPRKGLHWLLEAIRLLPPETCRLTVVGNQHFDPGYTQRIKHMLQDPRLSKQVNMTGLLKDDQIASLLMESHLLVVPSSYEGYGIVYLEGMGFGLPAIATTGGGAREIITPGLDGDLISPGDTHTLAQRLEAFSQDREKLAKTGLAARRRYLQHPTWTQSMEKARTFLERVAVDY